MTQAARLINHQINIALIIYSFLQKWLFIRQGVSLKETRNTRT